MKKNCIYKEMQLKFMCIMRYKKSLFYFTFRFIFFPARIKKRCQNNFKYKIKIVAFWYTRYTQYNIH